MSEPTKEFWKTYQENQLDRADAIIAAHNVVIELAAKIARERGIE